MAVAARYGDFVTQGACGVFVLFIAEFDFYPQPLFLKQL